MSPHSLLLPLRNILKVVEESENEVVIDFTNTEPSAAEATPHPAPEGKTIMEDPGPAHEVNRNPEVTAPSTEAPADTEPAPVPAMGMEQFMTRCLAG